MSAIAAVSRKVSTMSDGTLRLTVDIDPRFANDAFQLFGAPDVPMALARITQVAAQQQAQAETIAKEETLKGGQLARLAGMWCNDQEFYQWIRPVYDRMLGGNGNRHGDLNIGTDVADWKDFCRHAILVFCDINSRSELDNNEDAAEKFHRLIRIPYSQWLKERA